MKYFFLILMFPLVALATEPKCNGNGNCDDVNVSTVVMGGAQSSSNTTTVKGSKAFALSGGDMDIADCLSTYNVLFGLWQSTKMNKLCEAERLNQQGRYLEAAQMKCSIWGYRRVYGGRKECIGAVMWVYIEPIDPEPIVTSAPPQIIESVGAIEEHEEMEAELEQAKQQIIYNSKRIENENAQRRAAARKALEGAE
jgi:hypothetical protein